MNLNKVFVSSHTHDFESNESIALQSLMASFYFSVPLHILLSRIIGWVIPWYRFLTLEEWYALWPIQLQQTEPWFGDEGLTGHVTMHLTYQIGQTVLSNEQTRCKGASTTSLRNNAFSILVLLLQRLLEICGVQWEEKVDSLGRQIVTACKRGRGQIAYRLQIGRSCPTQPLDKYPGVVKWCWNFSMLMSQNSLLTIGK